MTGVSRAEVRLCLSWTQGRVTAARVHYRHPLDTATALQGRTAAAAPELVGTLFSICRAAQSTAAALACSVARGTQPPPDRRRAVLLELGREHARRLLLDWPAALGRPPRVRECRALLAALDAVARDPGEETLSRLEASLGEVVGAELGQTGTMPPPDGLLAAVAGPDALGIAPGVPQAPGRLDAGRLVEQLCAEAPQLEAEAGAVVRRANDPRVAERITRGEGLGARLAARLVELLELPAWLRGEAPVWGAASPAPGVGLAWVETARGLLAHRVELEEERIRDYRLLAPTDWNFGPGERLSGALAGMPSPDPETARQRAGLAVLALDPCVPAVVTVE